LKNIEKIKYYSCHNLFLDYYSNSFFLKKIKKLNNKFSRRLVILQKQAERISNVEKNQSAISESNCTSFYLKLERQCIFKVKLNNYWTNLLKKI
jgi:hypothetical protein